VLERYRRLRTKLIQHHAIKPFRSLVITSANPEEGKTVTTLNLALVFSMLPSFRVLVVDGDLRRASLSRLLNAEGKPGLSNLIEGSASLSQVVLKGHEVPFHCVAAGTSAHAAGELLHGVTLNTHLRSLTDHFDVVLVDSPPANVVADVHMLAGACDAVLLAVQAFRTTRKDLEHLVQEFQQYRIIGTVLNGSTRAQLYRQYSNY
jgi:capsular exopolysaccharide synthesis family protein